MGEQIGPYTVVEELRRGGMARTLLCRAPDQRLVVIKLPLHHDAGLFARLRDEHRVGRRVRHPHLVETIECLEYQGSPALVLAYVKGVPLADLHRSGSVPTASIARIGAQIASGLDALHGATGDDGRPLGIVHRDISSGNVLVTSSGEACLIDLGIARWDEARSAHTETGSLIGTTRYFAPELLADGTYSTASDVWALACCLVELLRGRPLFEGRTQDVLIAIARYDAPSGIDGLDVHTPLGAVLASALSRDPARRPSPAQMARRLAEVEVEAGGGQADLADLATRALTTGRARRLLRPGTPDGSPGSAPITLGATERLPPTTTMLASRRAFAAGAVGAVVVTGAVIVGLRALAPTPTLLPPMPPPAQPTAPPPTTVIVAADAPPGVPQGVSPPVSPFPPNGASGPWPPPLDQPPRPPTAEPPPDLTLPPRPPGLEAPVGVPVPPRPPRMSPDFERRLAESRSAGMAGQHQRALGLLLGLEREAPDHPLVQRGLGITYTMLGEQGLARQHLIRFVELAPGLPEAERERQRLGLPVR